MAAANAPSGNDAAEDRPSLIDTLVAGQVRAARCVADERAALARAAALVAAALRDGGRLVYAGAGSSGLLAMQDGLELPGTFGLAPERIRFVTPNPERFAIDGASEDDGQAAEAAVAALDLSHRDVVVALSASGSTPFTLAAAARAKSAGARLVAIVCRLGSPLAALADAGVVFDIGPEAVEGSTRLAAGTAQKAALGILSTLAAAELGWVRDGLMINLRPDNAKLRARAAAIVARLAGVDSDAAAAALEAMRHEVPAAIAAAAGRLDRGQARALVAECGGDISEILARANARKRSTQTRA